MEPQGTSHSWPAAEHILVCVGPGPHAARLVRAGQRTAAGLRANWTAVYVETPAHAHLPQEDRDWVTQHLRLAESLGARVLRLSGESVSDTLLAYAREHNVTQILAGKPTHPRWRDVLRGSLLDDIVRKSGDIDVYISRRDPAVPPRKPPPTRAGHAPFRSYVWSVLLVAAATLVAWVMSSRFQTSDLTLVYLLATVVVATRFGRGPSVLAAALGVAVFDFCFVPPYFSLTVRDDPYLLTFAVMLLVGLTVSTLATRILNQAEAARSHAQWAATLHALSRDLAQARDVPAIVATATRQLEATLEGMTVILLPSEDSGLTPLPGAGGSTIGAGEMEAARWAFQHGVPAGLGAGTFREVHGLYLPLQTGTRVVGVLGFQPAQARLVEEPEPRQMLEALAHQVAGALERALVTEEAKQTELRARTEELRNSLLSSVSHDLRTPLAAIMGSATTLLEGGPSLLGSAQDLARTIYEEAERLNRLVTNLLAMTQVESGSLRVKKEWVPLEEIVGAALERLGPRLLDRVVKSEIPEDLPLVAVDPLLMEQVFVNLLENAIRYTPPGTAIEIAARRDRDRMRVEMRDHGPGLAAGMEARVFEKFFRGPGAPSGGSGLGLAICRGIMLAHGGTIEAANLPGGGAAFCLALPMEGQPPSVPDEQMAGDETSHGGVKR